MAVADLIPQMNDAELDTLLGNARRITLGDDPSKRDKAAELLPIIEVEIATRAAAKPAPAPKVRKAKVAATPA